MRKKAELKGFDPGPLQVLQDRKPLGQHVFDNLKQAIIRGNIAPGEWLVYRPTTDKKLVEVRVYDDARPVIRLVRFFEVATGRLLREEPRGSG